MLRTIGITASSAIFVAAFIACGSEEKSTFDDSSKKDAGQTGGDFGEVKPPPPPIECNKMDLVFVIDNSPSMSEEQKNLNDNFPNFIKVLNEYKTEKGEELDYRIAVTSTDDTHDGPADKGTFMKSRGLGPDQACNPGPNNDPWLVRTPEVSDWFKCRAQLGVLGDNNERPLENAFLSLTARMEDGTNMKGGTEPFLRESALLGLVILTDEDEGGSDNTEQVPNPKRQNVDDYVVEFDKIKRFRGRWAAAVIAGDRVCNFPENPLGQAGDAKRLQQFVRTTGDNAIFHSICDGNLAVGLQKAIDTFTEACKDFPGVE